MKSNKVLFLAAAVSLGAVWNTSGSTLKEVGVNINGTITDDPFGGGSVPPYTVGGNGLGTANFAFGSGSHYFGIFFDHEINSTLYTYEIGTDANALAAGQSWEIDDPYNGDIFANFSSGNLDNTIGFLTDNDVSLALAWSFVGPAVVSVTVGTTQPASGFYLRQHNTYNTTANGAGTTIIENDPLDPNDDQIIGPDIFLFGTVTPSSPPPPGVPDGGATVTSLLLALGALGLFRVKNQRH